MRMTTRYITSVSVIERFLNNHAYVLNPHCCLRYRKIRKEKDIHNGLQVSFERTETHPIRAEFAQYKYGDMVGGSNELLHVDCYNEADELIASVTADAPDPTMMDGYTRD